MGCHAYCGSCSYNHSCSYYNHHWHGPKWCWPSYCHGSSCHGCGSCCASSHFCSGVANMNNYKNLEHYHRSLSDSYRHRAEDIRRHLSI